MTRLIDYRCQSCGSADVIIEATAVWDAERQRLVVSNTYDGSYCSSEECQGAECDVAEFDTRTGEALRRAPGAIAYIPKPETDAAWEAYRQQREAEREQHDRVRQQEHIIGDKAEILAAAYLEIVA